MKKKNLFKKKFGIKNLFKIIMHKKKLLIKKII